MRAIRFHETGGPEVLRLEDIPVPAVGPGQLLVKVEAAGLNYADVVRRRGDYYPVPTPLPHVSGSELAGIVERVGSETDEHLLGTRVVGTANTGAFADYAVLDVGSAFRLADGTEPAVGAALFVQGLTAAFVLTQAGRLAGGESVFVQGAAGGVGGLAVQLARLHGASTVIAGAGSVPKRAKAIALGADHAVDYTQPGWADRVRELTGGRGVDLMLEMTGGQVFRQSLDAMAPLGRIVVYGFASGEITPIVVPQLMARGLTLTAYGLPSSLQDRAATQTMLDQLTRWVRDGELEVEIAQRFPLEAAADAHRALERRGTTGKLVLMVDR